MQMGQQATGQKIVFVGSARMGHYQLHGHEVALFRFGIKFEINKYKNIPTKRMDGTCSQGGPVPAGHMISACRNGNSVLDDKEVPIENSRGQV